MYQQLYPWSTCLKFGQDSISHSSQSHQMWFWTRKELHLCRRKITMFTIIMSLLLMKVIIWVFKSNQLFINSWIIGIVDEKLHFHWAHCDRLLSKPRASGSQHGKVFLYWKSCTNLSIFSGKYVVLKKGRQFQLCILAG